MEASEHQGNLGCAFASASSFHHAVLASFLLGLWDAGQRQLALLACMAVAVLA